jgi:hypothetical protein
MKKLLLLGLVVIAMTTCKQEQRYFADSSEIASIKAGLASYESANWETWKSHFADTAKIYVNSTQGVSVNDRLTDLKNMTSAMSNYGFDHDNEYIEMVIDKDNKTWVYYWATHKATFKATNKEVVTPVHVAARFVDGKIVAEHIYYDATEMNTEAAAIAAMAEANDNLTEE